MIKGSGDTADIEAAAKADALLAEGGTEGQRVCFDSIGADGTADKVSGIRSLGPLMGWSGRAPALPESNLGQGR